MARQMKRFLAMTLAASMVMSVLSVASLAAEEETPVLVCAQAEHEHGEECYGKAPLTCEEEESEGHQHGEECYTETEVKTLICEDESEEHVHDEDCYSVTVEKELTCQEEESEGHQHGEDCYGEAPLICEIPEHTHGEDCYEVPEKEEEPKEEPEEEESSEEESQENGIMLTSFEDEIQEVEGFTATFDFETGTLTFNGEGELTKEIVDGFQFESSTPIEGISGDTSMGSYTLWRLNVSWKNDFNAGLLNGLVKKVIIGEGITAIGERALGGSGYANANYGGSGSRTMINVEELVLPEGLLTIGKSGFSMMGQKAENGLFQVNFPSSLERVSEFAFNQCTKLPKELTIEAPNVVIESSAFWYCTSIETLTIEGKELYDYVFSGCKNLKSVELKGMDTVGQGTGAIFDGCPNIETLTLTEVKNVEKYAFQGYTAGAWHNLKHLIVNGSDTERTKIGDYAFYYNYNLVDVTMNNVESIGKLAFYGAGWLDTVKLTNIGTIGEQAFFGYKDNTKWSQLKNVTINGCEMIGKQAFANCYYVTSLDLDNIGTISQDAFYYNGLLETVKMGKVGTIGQYAFRNCGKLAAIDSLKNVDRIDGFAFYGCSNLSGLTVEDLTKMGFNGNYGDVMDRVQKILAGEFKLDAAPGIVDITENIPEEDWDDGKVGKSENWNTYNNGTQLVEQARWTNTDKTEAEVKVDAYYTAPKQMDFIFVADLSASMAQLGNGEDMNSRFYDMQSKLLDVTANLLGSPESYDCQVAVVTFGGALDANNPGTMDFRGFTKAAGDVRDHINSLEPLYENTDYSLGLQKALELVRENKAADRATTVVFLSDGAPTWDGFTQLTADNRGAYLTKIAGEAQQIKDEGASIYGVLHSPSGTGEDARNAMKAVCDEVYESHNTESFGKAMNDAFTAVYPNYTVTIPVHEDFEKVRDLTVSVTGGEASYDEESHTITWTIDGMPFTKHTLTYKMSLTAENAGRYGEQSYDVNADKAVIAGGAEVETPVLTRNVRRPGGGGGGGDTTTYPLTIYYVYEDGSRAAATVNRRLAQGAAYNVASPSIEGYTADITVVEGTMPASAVTVTVTYTAATRPVETPTPTESTTPTPTGTPDEEDVPDEDTPMSELPPEEVADEDVPMTDMPQETVEDEDVPLADVPATGDVTVLWLAMAAASGCGLGWIKRKEDEEN